MGGADNVLALRGDPPRGQSTWRAPEGGVQSSLELASLAALAGFCVLGAAYPEPHPDSRGWAADLDHVKAKIDAGVRVLITQLYFDNDDYRRDVDARRAPSPTSAWPTPPPRPPSCWPRARPACTCTR